MVRLRLLERVPLLTKGVDLGQHSSEQGFRRGRPDTRSLELEDLLPLPPDLYPHALDLAPDVVDVRHVPPRELEDGMRTKKEQRVDSEVGWKRRFGMADNTQKDPKEWVSGDDPMTGAQESPFSGAKFEAVRLGQRKFLVRSAGLAMSRWDGGRGDLGQSAGGGSPALRCAADKRSRGSRAAAISR